MASKDGLILLKTPDKGYRIIRLLLPVGFSLFMLPYENMIPRVVIKVHKNHSLTLWRMERDNGVVGKFYHREKIFYSDKLKLTLDIKLHDDDVCLKWKVIRLPFRRSRRVSERIHKAKSERHANFRINQIHCDIRVELDHNGTEGFVTRQFNEDINDKYCYNHYLPTADGKPQKPYSIWYKLPELEVIVKMKVSDDLY